MRLAGSGQRRSRDRQSLWSYPITLPYDLSETMTLDSCFATQVDTVHDVPEPLRSALIDKIGSPEAVRLLLYVPAVSTIDERSPRPAPSIIPEILVPATALGITRDGWVV